MSNFAKEILSVSIILNLGTPGIVPSLEIFLPAST